MNRERVLRVAEALYVARCVNDGLHDDRAEWAFKAAHAFDGMAAAVERACDDADSRARAEEDAARAEAWRRSPEGMARAEKRAEITDRAILEALRSAPDGLTRTAIVSVTGESRSFLCRRLETLLGDGRIREAGSGRFALVNP